MTRTRSDIIRDISGAEAFADHYDDLGDSYRYHINKEQADNYRRELERYDRDQRNKK